MHTIKDSMRDKCHGVANAAMKCHTNRSELQWQKHNDISSLVFADEVGSVVMANRPDLISKHKETCDNQDSTDPGLRLYYSAAHHTTVLAVIAGSG